MADPGELLSLLRPVRLRLQVPIAGPYTQVLRRPPPEVEAFARGQCIALIRASRVRRPVPLYPSLVSCYGARGRPSLSPEDFQDAAQARQLLELAPTPGPLRYLAVPVGYVQLPDGAWVSRLAARATPWREQVVERWRQQVRQGVWLSVLRVYEFDPVALPGSKGKALTSRLRPFRLERLRPVLEDAVFARRLESLLEMVEQSAERGLSGYARAMGRTRDAVLQPEYSLEQFTLETGFPAPRLREWEERLRRKKQLVLYGPPGTGKTFLAERLARRLTGGTRGWWELVQFHPSYAYEDFVQGIRPFSEGGRVVYELAEGRFLHFCRQASERGEDAPCVLVVDEINRAHLPRVLGELMYLLEYRGRAIPLAAGGSSFQIPASVHLIGTMNTADRSIALVDQALRRRFTFVRLRPAYEVLAYHLEKRGYPTESLLAVLRQINHLIGNPDHELGMSFFLQDEELRAVLPQIWEGEIEPYLEEVFYDQPEKLEAFRWEVLARDRLADWVQDSP